MWGVDARPLQPLQAALCLKATRRGWTHAASPGKADGRSAVHLPNQTCCKCSTDLVRNGAELGEANSSART